MLWKPVAISTILPTDYTGLVKSEFPAHGREIRPWVSFQTFTNVLGRAATPPYRAAAERRGPNFKRTAADRAEQSPATISDGKVQYYYERAGQTNRATVLHDSSFVPEGKPTKITAGAELNVLASISGDGKSILLALNPRVNTDVQLVKYPAHSYTGGTNLPFQSFDINLPQYRTEDFPPASR